MKREDYFDVARTEPFSPLFWRDVFAEFVATCMLVTVQCFVPLHHGNPDYGGPVEVGMDHCLCLQRRLCQGLCCLTRTICIRRI